MKLAPPTTKSQLPRKPGAKSAPATTARAVEIGDAHDPLEVEADAIADRVLRMPMPAASGGDERPDARMSGASLVLRRACCSSCDCDEDDELRREPAAGQRGGTASESLSQRIRARMSGGETLASETRSFLEPRLGVDLGGVRMHRDGEAGSLARSVGARAFTLGRHIFLGQGQHRPGERDGMHLLAHEVAHTLQGSDAVHRYISFNASVAKSTITIVEESTMKTKPSAILFDAVVDGLNKYLGLRSVVAADAWRIESLVDSGNKNAIENQIRNKFTKEIRLQISDGNYHVITSEDAVGAWNYVRNKVRWFCGKDKVIREAPTPGGIAEKGDEITVDPEALKIWHVRDTSRWDLFWMFIHEILHVSGIGQAGLKDEQVSGNENFAEYKKSDRLYNGESKSLTVPGDVEYKLNIIRAGLDVPIRTNYSDKDLIDRGAMISENSAGAARQGTVLFGDLEGHESVGATYGDLGLHALAKKSESLSEDELRELNRGKEMARRLEDLGWVGYSLKFTTKSGDQIIAKNMYFAIGDDLIAVEYFYEFDGMYYKGLLWSVSYRGNSTEFKINCMWDEDRLEWREGEYVLVDFNSGTATLRVFEPAKFGLDGDDGYSQDSALTLDGTWKSEKSSGKIELRLKKS